MSLHRIFIFSVGLLSVLSTAAWADDKAVAAPKPQAPPPAVTVAAVTERDVNPALEYVGRVEAIQTVDIRPRAQGYLEKVAFEEGTVVKAGDLLYVIDQAPYRATVNEVKAKVASAEAAHAKTAQYLTRLKNVSSGGVSATDLDSAVSTELQARALVQEARAALETAELNLGYTTIKAPIDGRIGKTAFTCGNFVGPDSGALARIVQENPIRVVYSVSENDYVRVKMAHQAESLEQLSEKMVPRLRLGNDVPYPLEGRLSFVDNRIDPETGTLAIRLEFSNPNEMLLPGQYVTVLVSLSQGRRMPVVPQSAVLRDREGSYVLVVDADGKVNQRRITIGAAIETDFAVESGLMAGEDVIVQGIQKARPGQTVTPTRQSAS